MAQSSVIPKTRESDGATTVTNASAVEKQNVHTDALGMLGLQDRVFTAILKRVIPASDGSSMSVKIETFPKKASDRPNFSLPIMSNNFRRLNSRIGIVFVFQDKVGRLFSWKRPSHTLSFLAVYTLCCLNPTLLLVLPLAVCLFFIMVPAFVARHPPPPNPQLVDLHGGQGPASAPPANIKPAPEMSKAFFRNMRDLQNSMDDFTTVHDQILSIVAPLTNFSDERLSSTVFIGLFSTACLLFVTAFLLPWRVIFLLAGWLRIGTVHPTVAEFIRSVDKTTIKKFLASAQLKLYDWMTEDIALDEAPELREVEVFELQRQVSDSYWEPWVFSTSVYDPQSSLRASGDRPRGTQFFEDVQPPRGWEWNDKKWSLDLLSQEWVEERMITAVEVETDGERWVYDMDGIGSPDNKGEKVDVRLRSRGDKEDEQDSSEPPAKGEWRRRRWVRVVKRKTWKDSVNNIG